MPRDFPDPTKFGTTRDELERLGAEFFRCWQAEIAADAGFASWDDIPISLRERLARAMRVQRTASGVSVFFCEAIRCAANGNSFLAGKRFRTYFNLGYMQHLGFAVAKSTVVRRMVASTRGNAEKSYRAAATGEKIFGAAVEILEARKNKKPSQNRLAMDIARKTGIPKETARRYLKRVKCPDR